MSKPDSKTRPDPKDSPDPDLDRDLDEALEETFPASDTISPMEPREKTPPRRDARPRARRPIMIETPVIRWKRGQPYGVHPI